MAKKERIIWVCQTFPEHVFDECTDDEFCPIAPRYHGVLKPEVPPPPPPGIKIFINYPSNNQEFEEGNITISTDVESENSDISKVVFFVDDNPVGEDLSIPYNYNYYATKGTHSIYARAYDNSGKDAASKKVNITVTRGTVPEVGLSVLLMDASASMLDAPPDKNPAPVVPGRERTLTKMKLAAVTAASGIFDLDRMQNNPNALVAAFKFDDRLGLMYKDTIAGLIKRFNKDVDAFARDIENELKEYQQDTDINQALAHAHTFVDKFLRMQLTDLPVAKYRVMMQRVLKYGTAEAISIPNVRVLIYTDGKQCDSQGGSVLRPNPFVQYPLTGLNHDVVIGAFFGLETDEGCQEFKSLLSKCPIHDELQFFLIDSGAKIGMLKLLFRMASGASGFCPKCLEKEMLR